jgi:hypothetical protein
MLDYMLDLLFSANHVNRIYLHSQYMTGFKKKALQYRCIYKRLHMSVYEGLSKSSRTESITNYTLTTINTRREATRSVMAVKLTRPTHKIATQLHLVAESCTIRGSRSRRPVRKLLDTPSYIGPRIVSFLSDSVITNRIISAGFHPWTRKTDLLRGYKFKGGFQCSFQWITL